MTKDVAGSSPVLSSGEMIGSETLKQVSSAVVPEVARLHLSSHGTAPLSLESAANHTDRFRYHPAVT